MPNVQRILCLFCSVFCRPLTCRQSVCIMYAYWLKAPLSTIELIVAKEKDLAALALSTYSYNSYSSGTSTTMVAAHSPTRDPVVCLCIPELKGVLCYTSGWHEWIPWCLCSNIPRYQLPKNNAHKQQRVNHQIIKFSLRNRSRAIEDCYNSAYMDPGHIFLELAGWPALSHLCLTV